MATKQELENENEELRAKVEAYESADLSLLGQTDVDETIYPRLRISYLACQKHTLGSDLQQHQKVLNEIKKQGNYRVLSAQTQDSGGTEVGFVVVMVRD